MPAGRPTTYDPAYCEKVIPCLSVEEAKAEEGGFVYGLCRTGLSDMFYVGSTIQPAGRFRTYARGVAHKNAKLDKALSEPFQVLVLERCEEGVLRKTEFDWIDRFNGQLVNIVTRHSGFVESGVPINIDWFMRTYRNRFNNESAKEFMDWFRSRLSAMTPEQLENSDQYFAELRK